MNIVMNSATAGQPSGICALSLDEIDEVNGGSSDRDFYIGVAVGVAIAILLA